MLSPEQSKVIRDWVAALRSGNYLQGIGCLMRERDKMSTYCCLGVLACVANVPHHKRPANPEHAFKFPGYDGARTDAVPVVWFQETTGLWQHVVDALIEMNDNDLASFEQIATHIEKLATGLENNHAER
jgi:hypothetical protein